MKAPVPTGMLSSLHLSDLGKSRDAEGWIRGMDNYYHFFEDRK